MCLTSVLFRVQYFVLNASLVEQTGEQLALFNADGSNKNRLTKFVLFFNVIYYRNELCLFRLVNKVCLVLTNHLAVCRNGNNCQVVGIH